MINRGFGLESCSRGPVFPDGTAGQPAEARCSRTRTLQAQITNTASDGLAPSSFDSSLEHSTDKVVLFWQPPSNFSQWSPSSFLVDGVSYSCAEQYTMADKARLCKGHRAVELIMSSPDASTHKRIGRGVRSFDSACLERREAKCCVSWHLCQIYAESRHEKSPFEHWQQSQPYGPSVGHWSPGG